MAHWLVKSEPAAYSWDNLVRDGSTAWTGVRNFQARIHLRAMQVGDPVLVYHSVTGKCVMGVARVARAAFPDPTAESGDWSAVELVPDRALARPVDLERIKTDPVLANVALVRQSRLSVMPLTRAQFERVIRLGT
jgi:predicted RNA-binding protein with PUA-like domain